MSLDVNELALRFTHHPPKDEQELRYNAIRDYGRSMAVLIVSATPQSREQELALTRLEEAVMWANAAIARRE